MLEATHRIPTWRVDEVIAMVGLEAVARRRVGAFSRSHHLSPWGGFALFCDYTGVAVAAAAATLPRRDA